MYKVQFLQNHGLLLGICYFNGTNNWRWNNSKWNYDSSFLVLVGHLYRFSRKSCQFMVCCSSKNCSPYPLLLWEGEPKVAGWPHKIYHILLHQHTHDASLFLRELSHHHHMKLFKRNTTQSCSRERLRLQASGMHKRPTSEEQEHKRQVKDKRFGRGYLMWPKGIGSAFSPWT